jgi:hypothetical protein
MKASINTQTGLMIESQSDSANDDVLRSNAAALGIFNMEIRVVTDAEHEALIAKREAANKTPEQLAAEIDAAFDAHIDSVAAQRGYKRAGVTPSASCIGYAGYPNPYQAEAIKFGQWVADCCALLIAERAKVVAGTRTMPTPAEAIAELPPMVW